MLRLRRLGETVVIAAATVAFLITVTPARHASLSTKMRTAPAAARLKLAAARTSPSDLEVGVSSHVTRFLRREQLLALPQVTYTVTNDANFHGPVRISGVALEELIRQIGIAPASDLAIAICSDNYRATYPRAYISAHHPVLVLTVNGQGPEGWPKGVVGNNVDMGPYLISSPDFKPRFTILSYSDEPQIPWGVVRLEFQNEAVVFGAIAPPGPQANSKEVQDGFQIAQQNCLRCHDMGRYGGTKAERPWAVLSLWATTKPDYFAAYIRNPKSKNPKSQMPGFPEYDDATVQALSAYFRTFHEAAKR